MDSTSSPETGNGVEDGADGGVEGSSGGAPLVSSLRRTVLLSTGEAFLRQKRYGIARRLFQEALGQNPASPRALTGLGRICNETGEAASALRLFMRLAVFMPEWPDGVSGCAHTFSHLDDFAAAGKWYRRALTTTPGDKRLSFSLGVALLRSGNWKDGFAAYEARQGADNLRQTIEPSKVWDGRTDITDKRFLIIGEQGFGDHIQFMRYSKLLKERGAGTVIFFTRPELGELAAAVPWIDEVVTDRQKIRCDFAAMLLSLPRLFGTLPDSIPVTAPYIPLGGALQNATGGAGRPGNGASGARAPRILIAWKGNPRNSRDALRSAPPERIAALIRRFHKIDFYALPFDLPLNGDDPDLRLAPLCSADSSFADVARAMAGIDLVLSVDTSLAHLAAAIGKPVWTMIARQPDWRWLASGEESIWYDSMRLFRITDSWHELIERVCAALESEFPAGAGADTSPSAGKRHASRRPSPDH